MPKKLHVGSRRIIVLLCLTGGQNSYSVLGLSVSAHFVPFGSLMLTTVLIPRASFLGHLAGEMEQFLWEIMLIILQSHYTKSDEWRQYAGIIVGYAAAFGAFAWMTPFWTLSLALWAVLGAHVCAAWSSGGSHE